MRQLDGPRKCPPGNHPNRPPPIGALFGSKKKLRKPRENTFNNRAKIPFRVGLCCPKVPFCTGDIVFQEQNVSPL